MKSFACCFVKARAFQPHRCFSMTFRRRANDVRVVEVGPRDGLQNEAKGLDLSTKLDLIRRLSKTGVEDIEAGSFVSSKWVPQMANSVEVLHDIRSNPPLSAIPISYNFLIPNERGMNNFLEAFQKPIAVADPAPITSTQDPNAMPSISDITAEESKEPSNDHTTSISIFLAATESFSRANINCSIAESISRSKPIVTRARELSIPVRAYISVALGCPYEGPDVSPQKVAELARTLLEMGVDEVSVADTTGMGTAPKTLALMTALAAAGVSPHDLALHFHDTYGQALVNVCVGLEHGVRVFDSAVGGLGGCPFSKGATGNVSTEDLVHCLHSLGMSTGIDVEEMSRVGAWISKELGRPNESRAGKAVLARLASA